MDLEMEPVRRLLHTFPLGDQYNEELLYRWDGAEFNGFNEAIQLKEVY